MCRAWPTSCSRIETSSGRRFEADGGPRSSRPRATRYSTSSRCLQRSAPCMPIPDRPWSCLPTPPPKCWRRSRSRPAARFRRGGPGRHARRWPEFPHRTRSPPRCSTACCRSRLPIPLGALAYVLFRRRYPSRGEPGRSLPPVDRTACELHPTSRPTSRCRWHARGSTMPSGAIDGRKERGSRSRTRNVIGERFGRAVPRTAKVLAEAPANPRLDDVRDAIERTSRSATPRSSRGSTSRHRTTRGDRRARSAHRVEHDEAIEAALSAPGVEGMVEDHLAVVDYRLALAGTSTCIDVVDVPAPARLNVASALRRSSSHRGKDESSPCGERGRCPER